MKSGRLTLFVLLGMCLGVLIGLTGHALITDPVSLAGLGDALNLITVIFLRAIKMLIAPLVLTTLLSGITRAAASGSLGRIALHALAWFLCVSIAALLIGLAVVETLKPGVGMHLGAVATVASPFADVAPPTFSGFLEHLLPTSILDAMAHNDVLQIVMFTLIAGVALAQLGDCGEEILRIAETISNLILKMAGFVMMAAPIAVFSALASVLLKHGISIVGTFASYVGEIYLALTLLWALILIAGALVLGPREQWRLMKAVREPALLAFATTSSESAYPVLLAHLESFGVPNRIASFVLPLGYSFNLVGSMCYGTFAALFLAQAYDVPLTASQITQLLLLLLLASKGIANVPRASLLVVAAILPYFHIPEAGVLLIMAVDSFVDMGRTCTNTVATAIAAASVAKWDGTLKTRLDNDMMM